MPVLARVYIRTSLVYLVLSVGLGALILLRLPLNLPDFLQAYSPVYFHLFMVGWVTQMIFGVSWWMFPHYPGPKNPRGREWITWWVYGLLNGGLLLRAVAEPLMVLVPNPVWTVFLALSALFQVVAGWTYAFQLWPRIRAPQVKN